MIRVVGADEANLRRLRALERYRDYEFVPLYTDAEMKGRPPEPLEHLLSRALSDVMHSRPAAVIAYWDFPANAVAHYLSRRLGLPTPSMESVLACSHKHWARSIEASVCPHAIPTFEIIDPFADAPFARLRQTPPYWIKPIKATGSALSYFAASIDAAGNAVHSIRAEIETFAEPFNYIMSLADVPDRVRAVDGYHCIVESDLPGSQCTLSGYVHRGEVVVMGVVDSLSFPYSSAFSAFVYPSSVPRRVRERMSAIARDLIGEVGLSESGFNIEFFHDETDDALSILEINPRFSQSHAELFSRVDGTSNHQLLVDLALENEPIHRSRAGRYAVAVKFFHRVFRDVRVTRVPDNETVERVRTDYDCDVVVQVREGALLRHRATEDVQCHDLAHVYVGAESYDAARETYGEILRDLGIRYEEEAQ